MNASTRVRALILAGLIGAAPLAYAAQESGGKPLYERLGGQAAIVAVVDDFVANVAADGRINGFFAATHIPTLKARLVEQICAGTGGPCTYRGRDMKSAHAGMGVRDEHFGALVEDLVKTLDKFKVPAREKDELIGILAPMKTDIVTAGVRPAPMAQAGRRMVWGAGFQPY